MVKSKDSMKEKTEEINDLGLLVMETDVKNVGVVKVFRQNPHVELPSYQTSRAGCFDLAADLSVVNSVVRAWIPSTNQESEKRVREDSTGRYIVIDPQERVMIPTGIVVVLPPYCTMNTFIRSSVGMKKGLLLSNGVGYIDNDYRNELFIPVINTSKCQVRVDDKERIAQGEVRAALQFIIEETNQQPAPLGDRKGGFGSTNKKG